MDKYLFGFPWQQFIEGNSCGNQQLLMNSTQFPANFLSNYEEIIIRFFSIFTHKKYNFNTKHDAKPSFCDGHFLQWAWSDSGSLSSGGSNLWLHTLPPRCVNAYLLFLQSQGCTHMCRAAHAHTQRGRLWG